MDERELLEKLKNRDEEGLQMLVNMYEQYIQTIVFRVIGNIMTREDIQEVVNDSFHSIWQHADALDESKGSVCSYLTATARNKAKNKLREQKPLSVPIQEEDVVDVSDIWQQFEQRERAKLLKEALEHLKSEEREIMIRYYYRYETTEEIAAIMGIRRNTVKSKLMRGREKLKNYLIKRGICQ